MRHQSNRKQTGCRTPYGQSKTDYTKVWIRRSAEPYVYTSLGPGPWMRILELQPGEDNDPIICDLSIVNQNQSPKYEALSYTWGRSTDTRLISCCGKKLKIGVHLRDALRKLRRTSGVRHLWADAVCIDQSNVQERGHQVSMMGSIYAGAERVVVWLGNIHAGYLDDQEESLPALALRFLSLDCEKPGFPENDLAENLQSTDLEADLVEFLTAISEISRLPYFSRLWVLQEVGLGKSVVALLGNREFDIIVVLRILAFLRNSVTLLRYFRIRSHAQLAFSLYPILSSMVFGEANVGTELDFLDMLIWTQSQMASDPRDYVYALLGHPSALIRGNLIVEPDYTKAPAALFHEVAVKLIENGQDLRVLSSVYHRSEADLETDYPSWVPTWTRDGHPGRIGNDVRFDASAGLPCSWNFGESHMTIYIQGFIIDVVDQHSRSFNSSDFLASPDVLPVDMLDKWPVEDALEFKSRVTISLDEKLCEIGRLITGLSTFPTGKANQLRETTALSLYMKERTTNGLKRDKTGLQRMMDSRGDTRLMQELIFNCAHSLEDRKLFSTQSGLLGLGPSIAREGDLCCILFGATVPIVLRKMGSTYRLVGEAHISGVMHGEAYVDFLLAEKYREQIFDIC